MHFKDVKVKQGLCGYIKVVNVDNFVYLGYQCCGWDFDFFQARKLTNMIVKGRWWDNAQRSI
jgi:hypothetical protein